MSTIVVIGGDAAGMSAASKARRTDPNARIIVLEMGAHTSYAACGLPYLIEGIVNSADDLVARTPEQHRAAGIDVRTRTRATAIDTRSRTVNAEGADGAQSIGYDKLIIATGASPKKPAFCDGACGGVFTLKTIPDALGIQAHIARGRVRRAIVVGGGYIGVEMSEALTRRGIAVTLVEHGERILKLLDPDMSERIAAYMSSQGVAIHTEREVVAAQGTASVESAQLSDGSTVAADMIVVGAGVAPNADLARNAGIALGASGAIAVDSAQRTSAFHVYAAGDCAEARHLVLDRNVYIPLGTTANKQGRVAGENVAGGSATFAGVVGTTVCKVFGKAFARTGLTEEQARRAGFAPKSATVAASSRAEYYGSPETIDVKIVYDGKTRRLLGAQLFGDDTVAKRIDVVATALTARMIIDDFVQLDLSYAPPFAPVWDPLLVAANVAGRGSRTT
ncbi:NADH oxidase [Candidatus Poribacteria bacterium]|nr:NADH oxidase [Candidatus Poribacteria bacterium]